MLNNLGVLHAQAGNPLLAVQTYERGLGMLGDLANATELRPMTAGNRASSLAELGRAAEAIEELTRARDHVRRQGQLQEAALHQQLLARASCTAGELARCEAELALSREEMARHVPPGRTSLALNDIIAAELALKRDRPVQARAALQQAMAIFAGSPRRVGMRHTLALMARAELALGNTDAAAARAADAVARERERRVPTIASEWLGQALLAQGLVAQAQHLPERARVAWTEAELELQASVGAQAPITQEARRLLQGR